MNKTIPEKETLIEMYSLGHSMQDIANSLKMSVGKIHKYFVIYEIKPRKHLNEKAKSKISVANKNNKYRTGKKATIDTKEKMKNAKLKKGIGHKKIRKDGYIAIYFPDHPKSNKDGYIMEYILVMECFIGRWLRDNEVVHHINRKKNDNRIENLKLMTRNEHAKFHMLERYEKKKGMKSYQ